MSEPPLHAASASIAGAAYGRMSDARGVRRPARRKNASECMAGRIPVRAGPADENTVHLAGLLRGGRTKRPALLEFASAGEITVAPWPA
jgi:hypothetical protein